MAISVATRSVVKDSVYLPATSKTNFKEMGILLVLGDSLNVPPLAMCVPPRASVWATDVPQMWLGIDPFANQLVAY